MNLNHTWEPIVFVTLTRYPSNEEFHMNLQSIEAISDIPGYPGKDSSLPPVSAIHGKSGRVYQVMESYEEIIVQAVKQIRKANG